jgi:uncharacterized phage-like protein YoqJ
MNYEELKKKYPVTIQVLQMGVDLKNGRYPKIAFTGHRPDKLGGYGTDKNTAVQSILYDRLYDVCSYLITNNGATDFMEGMAQGIDQLAGRVIMGIISEQAFEDEFKRITRLHAAIPYPGQESIWPKKARETYQDELDRIEDYKDYGSSIHYVHDKKPSTKYEAVKWLDERNHYMVDWCDLLIAVWNGSKGGTGNCIQTAKAANKPILLLKISI